MSLTSSRPVWGYSPALGNCCRLLFRDHHLALDINQSIAPLDKPLHPHAFKRECCFHLTILPNHNAESLFCSIIGQ